MKYVEIKCQLDATEVFYCRSYCLLNMFRASLCPSSGAKEYYTVVAAYGIWLDATKVFIADLIACSTCFGHHYAHHQELKSIIQRLLPVRFAGCCSILQTGHITLSSTPDQQLENHSTKYHSQQPLYNTLELLMMGKMVPETC
jgi:hypothetical protein